ncbi:MAG: hypothetical protein COT81_04585 [Candidatus Buchananbacteria bacterium CG10_big_fil_rev_8_21_14_0_10_42_9]|uniref:Peptidoglycan binding-like domain-containing protein n=1 Tax=Candidatus Buchananbacteria bacterium CG10_big_fil_rev_8_21_14_0_10_42_9 TaxID=1974526 RepID=A0A2H0W0F7_9BACT|nr:MAG: hypothetical protein COT81_04585 [Candidatus Buchananbacteria bacterium CG10_big_fil_rev_8_21_14_0_10_42_9]
MFSLNKRITNLFIAVLLFALAFPAAVLAEVTISGNITINIPDAGINLTVSSATGIDDFAVSGPSVTFTLSANDTVTVVPPNGYTLSNDIGASNNCSGQVTFTATVVVTPIQCTGPTGGSGSSAGGGGGLSVVMPTNAVVEINNGATETQVRTVALSLNAVSASQMIISNNSDFTGASFESFQKTKTWVLSEGAGEKTVYVKFRSVSGGESAVVSDKITYLGESGETVAVVVNLDDVPAVKTAIGALVKSTVSASTYFIGGDGKRYIFPSYDIYRTWFGESFSGLITQSEDDVTAFPLGGNVKVRPGLRLVQAVTNDTPWQVADPKVYAVAGGSVLRHVSNAEVAVALYGENWESLIVPVVETVFTGYEIGAPITTAADFDPLAEALAYDSINKNFDLPEENKNSNPTVVNSTQPGTSSESSLAEGNFVSLLTVGSAGDEVRQLQDVLKAEGFLETDIDSTGYFGPLTETAVKKFQAANGIDALGYVGPATRAALNNL